MSILCYFCIYNSILSYLENKIITPIRPKHIVTVTLLVEDSAVSGERSMQAVAKSWRDSASLIVVGARAARSARGPSVNYDILLQTRTRSASFPNSVVFPGGVSEPADAARAWRDHLAAFGFTGNDFDCLHRPGTTITPIFQDNPVQRHISLRITAIRETFEELGLLLCSRAHKKDRSGQFASVVSDVDTKHWQKRISENPEELLDLCKEYDCYPDIWSLHYWSNWLSPVHLPKRFSTAFFVTALEDKPSLKSNKEVVDVQWSCPVEVLENPELVIYPPQVYELQRLCSVPHVEDLVQFARQRSCYGEELMFPVLVQANDGIVHLLPGDDLYPSTVDYNDTTFKSVDKSVEELRESSNTIHRFELAPTKQFVLRNYKPKNHINMGDRAIAANVVVH